MVKEKGTQKSILKNTKKIKKKNVVTRISIKIIKNLTCQLTSNSNTLTKYSKIIISFNNKNNIKKV